MELLVANPRGFCAGVDRAIAVVDDLLEIADGPVYVRHAIVHNREVVRRLSARGARFVEDTRDVPHGAVMVLSAHGAAPFVHEEARARNLTVIDATCPLVTRVQLEVMRQSADGNSVIIIGHRGHVEVDGIAGNFKGKGVLRIVENEEEASVVQVPDPDAVGYVTQTTLAVSHAERIVQVLQRRFPNLIAPRGDTICYATQNRQDAVRTLAAQSDVIFVIGAPHSSNSNRMAEVAREAGCRAYLIEMAGEIGPERLSGVTRIGLTSGASAPEQLVQEAIGTLRRQYPGLVVRDFGVAERLRFKPPASLAMLRRDTTMDDAKTSRREPMRLDGLKDVLDAAADLATQVRETAIAGARVGERELAMLIGVTEETRDRTFSEQILKEARAVEIVAPLRGSAHRAVDLAFDGLGIGVRVTAQTLDRFLSAPRRGEPKVSATPA